MEKIYGFVRMAIKPGQTDAFVAGARACHEAALPDLTGTELYEWFLSADGQEAWVIEVYDDPAAVAHHGRMMDGKATLLRDYADISITFAGQVPVEMMDRMRERLGAAEYFGPRAAGLLNDPVTHRAPEPADSRICALAWFTPKPGKEAALKSLAMTSFARAKADDPGTMAYEWFFDDNGRALALDVYRDADAMLAHMRNCGETMGEILKISDSQTRLFGALPPAIAERMRPELGITHYPRRLHGMF